VKEPTITDHLEEAISKARTGGEESQRELLLAICGSVVTLLIPECAMRYSNGRPK
jgi:hypothetical protein